MAGERARVSAERARWQEQAGRRAARAGGVRTAEDEVLGALLSAQPGACAEVARALDAAPFVDQDYLAYWVDALGLQASWSEVERRRAR